MFLDAFALALIAYCTAYEGYEDWLNPLHVHYPYNIITIFFWIIGLCLAVVGLLLIIVNAASYETLPLMEHIGMAMLTFAPVVNTLAWCCLHEQDPAHLELEEYLSTEFLEFFGMFLVCCSYWNHDITSTYFELAGYTVLSCAALWDVSYPLPSRAQFSLFPVHFRIIIRSGFVHWSEALGLFLLGIVAIGKYLLHDEIHPPHFSSSEHKKYDSSASSPHALDDLSSGLNPLLHTVGIPIGSAGFSGVGGVISSHGSSSGGLGNVRKGD
jgi:hypothetical protein